MFLHRLVEGCPYTIKVAYTDDGTVYTRTPDNEFVKLCTHYEIDQESTNVANTTVTKSGYTYYFRNRGTITLLLIPRSQEEPI